MLYLSQMTMDMTR